MAEGERLRAFAARRRGHHGAHDVAWTIWLLTSRPEVQAPCAGETDEVLGEHPFPIAFDTVGRLGCGEAVLGESMRLRPVTPVIGVSSRSRTPSSPIPESRLERVFCSNWPTERKTVGVLTAFGVVVLTFMMLMYALERRGPRFILAFAWGCALSSVYGFLAGTWPFGVVEAIWAVIALGRYGQQRSESN